jgi:hypothetical protein
MINIIATFILGMVATAILIPIIGGWWIMIIVLAILIAVVVENASKNRL